MTRGELTLRYLAFAIVATAGNLAVQRLVLQIGDDALAYGLALVAGTFVGLVIKYALDKRWIFAAPIDGVGFTQIRTFSLYTLTGVATTAIFWSAETLSWMCWNTQVAREAGAIAGLALGYVVKYRLDRRYVFGGAARAGHTT